MTTKFTLFIGLNDKDSKIQEIDTINAYKIVTRECIKAFGGATIKECKGIYTHDNGEIVTETTLETIVFTDNKSKVIQVIEFLKKALNQESIILQKEIVESEFI